MGALTVLLVHRVKKLYVVEIEPQFCLYLKKKFSESDNLEIINNDILKSELPFYNKVVSNIPYSITGPIFEKVFFNANPPQGILTIERKLADRILWKGNYKDFSRITVSVNSFLNPTEHYKISRNSFYPPPKIDLSLLKLLPKEKLNPFLMKSESQRFFLKFIAGIMPYKNKNIANAVKLYFKKEYKVELSAQDILKKLQEYNFQNFKVSNLKLVDFPNLCRVFYDSNYIN